MDFILKLEWVADKDNNPDNYREDEDYELKDGDDVEWHLVKEKNKIKRAIEGFKECGNDYFKHSNKEKIETSSRWCTNTCIACVACIA